MIERNPSNENGKNLRSYVYLSIWEQIYREGSAKMKMFGRRNKNKLQSKVFPQLGLDEVDCSFTTDFMVAH